MWKQQHTTTNKKTGTKTSKEVTKLSNPNSAVANDENHWGAQQLEALRTPVKSAAVQTTTAMKRETREGKREATVVGGSITWVSPWATQDVRFLYARVGRGELGVRLLHAWGADWSRPSAVALSSKTEATCATSRWTTSA
tara:strand:- start:2242 stop:2661 length:420 start_codon:yes stop_codon:yes gene_type:complete